MKNLKKLLTSILLTFVIGNLSVFSLVSAQNDNVYDQVINETIGSTSVSTALKWDDVSSEKWANLVNAQILAIIGYVINVFIIIWIAVAFIGWYKIMVSNKEESLKDGIRLVIFGIIWIIIMVSARFLAESLVWNGGVISWEFGILSEEKDEPNWINFATNLYNNILYPFIKIALYLVVWFLFFMMAAKVVSYVTATDDSVKKKAWWVIIWSVIGILIVMWSKQLVEAVMWKQDAVLNYSAEWINGDSEKWMWNEILNFESLPIVTQIINWVMWLTMLIILVLIIIQWYKMFTKPDDPKNRESLKKTLLYIIIWVLVIWSAYAISSVLVINNIPITE